MDEKWFDCDTYSPADLKERERTPIRKSTPSQCPPAPCRFDHKLKDLSDDELEPDDELNDFNISGIKPLDSSIELTKESKSKYPPQKRLRRADKQEESEVELTAPRESKFSDLFYLEVTATVAILKAQSNDEQEKRECKIRMSYRVKNEDSEVFQIALIVYKSNSKNPKTRRNLMSEFQEKSSEPCASTCSGTPRCRFAGENRTEQESRLTETPTEVDEAKHSKALKRSIGKSSLRF